MKVKELAIGRFQVVAVVDGDKCPAEDFIVNGEISTAASREGLLDMLEKTAQNGLHGIAAAWIHEADKQEKIYEFIKGRLRLFFFKGENGQIAICTNGQMKKSTKADKSAIAIAALYRKKYFKAIREGTLQVIKNETE